MTKTQPRPFIPSGESQLVEAIREDGIIKISYSGTMDNFESQWTIYDGEKEGKDRYVAQRKATIKGDADLVVIHTTTRRTTQFDRNLGLLINHLYHDMDFVGPVLPQQREEYERLKDKLQKAGLWYEEENK